MEEFSGAALGDSRLTKRLIRLVDDLAAQPTQSIPQACGRLAETKAGWGGVERLERALVIYLVIAWRILYPMTLRRDCPHPPCEVAFSAEEFGRKGDGHPGPKALWDGMMKLMAYVETLQTVHEACGPSATCG